MRTGANYSDLKSEKIPTLVVENFPALGKIASLRFLEWAQHNNGHTVSLPTGKTPEFFIKWVQYLLTHWERTETVALLEEHGLDPAYKPDMRNFTFVQIDEFYPIDSAQTNSFYHYVQRYYLRGFGFDPRKALLINCNAIGLESHETLERVWPYYRVDLSLRTRSAKNSSEERQKRVLEKVDQFCTEYEERIRKLGGIGFFLGGIGPDGHIGFNVRGSDHFSTTRLCATNYETQAAAAIDLGGIEISRDRLVITIGLATICYSPKTTAIIMVAGEAKSAIVREAVTAPRSNFIPASALQKLPQARFYLTQGAAKLLSERRYRKQYVRGALSNEEQIAAVYELALKKQKPIADLTLGDFRHDPSTALILSTRIGERSFEIYKADIRRHFVDCLNNSLTLPKGEVFLHTAPHHDDIILGYISLLTRLIRDQSNTHYFNYLTSGFTAVTNYHMQDRIRIARSFLTNTALGSVEKDYFSATNQEYKNRDVLHYLDGVAAVSKKQTQEGTVRRFLRNLNENYGDKDVSSFLLRLNELERYFEEGYPGKKDRDDIQRLKGMVREWEADLLWGFFGFKCNSVIHSRLGFYQGQIFTEEPEHNRDVMPIVAVLRRVQPTIVSVALDPEGSGPDTHYKVLQAITAALKHYQKEEHRDDIEIWGYRNVWYRYHPSEVGFFAPVTLTDMATLREAFLDSFATQADASFPSYEYDGPFSELAQRVQVEQYRAMKTVLGRDFFYLNNDPRIRSTRGLVYLKKMSLEDFYKHSRALQEITVGSRPTPN